jgi:hypothetical protein
MPVTHVKTIRGDSLRFSHKGNSGALIVIFERDLMGNVIRTSAVGIIYAVLLEGAALRPTDAFFLSNDGCSLKDKEGNRVGPCHG